MPFDPYATAFVVALVVCELLLLPSLRLIFQALRPPFQLVMAFLVVGAVGVQVELIRSSFS